MRHRRRALLVALSLAPPAFLAPLRADAQPRGAEGIDVAWTAPDECPSSADLQRRVSTRVPGDAAVRARGRVEKRSGRYRLVLDIATASSRGERALDASTCEALASSAAVVIAISVAPAGAPKDEVTPAAISAAEPAAPATLTAAAPAPAAAATPATPGAAPAAAASPPLDRASEPEPRRASGAPARFLVRAEIAGDSGLLPEAAVGGGLALGIVPLRDVSIEASATLFGAQDGTLPGSPARGASFGLFVAAARACWTLTHTVEIAPCLGAEVARISASGFGAAKVSDADAVTWGPEALLAGRIAVAGPISVRVGLGAFAPISRQSFVINAGGTVHQPAAVALRTWAGPEVRF